MALIECLAARYEQRVIVRRDGLLHEKLSKHAGPSLSLIPVPSSIPAAVRAVRNVDLLHVHEGRSVQVGAWCSLFGTPFIATRRVPSPPQNNPATRWFYRRADMVVGVSEAVSNVMRAYLGSDKVQTILSVAQRLTTDAARVAELRERYAGKLVVGHVGELDDSHKGQRLILAAAELASKTHPNLHFMLVGSGRDERELREQAQGLQNVEFVGQVDNVGDYYSVMDLFVFPSREEALGSAILEAMSFGLPVIGSRVGGIPEVVRHDDTGFLIDSGDVRGMLESILRLEREPMLRQKMAQSARALVAERRIEVAAERYAAIYERVLGQDTGI